jgi:sigma-B regulation protein RsbU (phosphoserine phosphatase)
MLPALPQVPGIEFAAIYDPAASISGDFYDFIPVGENMIGVAVGDVSGHGVEAGIVTGMVRKAFQIYAKGKASATETLIAANADLAQDLDGGTFISASYGVLNTDNRTFRFARAGHNPALLTNPARSPQLTEIKPNGMVIGPDRTGKRFAAALQEQVVNLQQGDLIFQYTDGLVEAANREKKEFGQKHLHELLLKSPHLNVAELANLIEDVVQSHIGAASQEDDITIIAFRVH